MAGCALSWSLGSSVCRQLVSSDCQLEHSRIEYIVYHHLDTGVAVHVFVLGQPQYDVHDALRYVYIIAIDCARINT